MRGGGYQERGMEVEIGGGGLLRGRVEAVSLVWEIYNLNPPTCSWQRHLHPMPHRPDLSPGRRLLRQLPGRLLC